MKDINLLPRKPFLESAFRPLLALIVLMMLAISGIVIYFHKNYDSDLHTLKDEISRMESEYSELSEARRPDPMLSDYQAYRDTVAALDASRRDWLKLLTEVTGLMPARSRALSISANEQGTMHLSMEFSRWEDIAIYMSRLRGSEQLESVELTSVMQTPRTLAAARPEPAETYLPEPSPEIYTPPAYSGADQQAPNSETLDELVEVITRKAEIQQFGWSPSESDHGQQSSGGEFAGAGAEDNLSGGAISLQELQRAKERLEQFKSPPVQQPSAEVVTKDPAAPEMVQVYLVSLELRLAAKFTADQGAGP